jgi:hypothetical protein
LVEEGLHDVGPDDRQDQAEGGVALRADRAEQVDGGVALVFDAGGSRTLLKPSAAVPAGLASSCSQTSIRSASGWAAVASAIRPRNFF